MTTSGTGADTSEEGHPGPNHTTQPASPPTWGTEFPETTGVGLNKPVLIVAVLGLALAVFGVIRSFVAPTPKQAAATPPVVTYMSEQQRMMRDAIQMAREAREAQREHMDLMRRAMEESETGYPAGGG